jgi:hypothetical protein
MKDTEEFIESLPAKERVIVKLLREIILDVDPRITEKLSYGVPYFSRNRRICFIWPQSAPYGPKDALVSLGFCYGHMLSNDQRILKHEGRTQVFIVGYSTIDEINDREITEILIEALMVDDLPFSATKI